MGHARDARYAARSPHDLLALLRAQPMAWLVSAGGDDAAFTPLPLRAECAADGRLLALRGHLARRNPHVARLRRDPQAQALVLGPHAYVSPSWLDDRTQAPTWNYAAAVFTLRVEVDDSAAAIAAELQALVTAMEAGRDAAWRLEEMGERYARLAVGVSALRGEIVDVRATFKLGQDERAQDFAQILAGLGGAGAHALVDWMRAFAADAPAPGADA
ncbi:FMN-binding negative transcriptional regulator [Xanthomonas sp. AmX2]|uniref:FMN-binding negative transcriptional regulator n=1 Tax=Xanthomonas sp. TaxID=29446 RepID=UPI00197E0C2F|nr:FMN-binding negative transcriptional regulator [Xanthomonas sp.]MBN6152056.1 FMN-binding negative transcriptional regulator [Xanthomonas sp.]